MGSTPPTLVNPHVRAMLLALVVAAASWWSIVYTRGPLGFSTLWIAGGIATGYLLSVPRREWPLALVATAAAMLGMNLWRNGAGPLAFALSGANLFETWVVAAVVARRIGDASSLRVIRRSTLLAAITTIAACSVAGLFAALARGHWVQAHAPVGVLFLTWLASHALGMAIFATLTIAARVEGRRLLGKPGRRLEFAGILALIVATCVYVFLQSRYGLTFLLFPPLLLCVFRHRFSGFVYASAIVALVATTLTAQGRGPFNMGDVAGSNGPTFVLQLFLASVCLVAFPMAAVLTERRLLLNRIAVNERMYRMLADNTSDLVGHVTADRQRRYISPSVTEMLGYTIEEFDKVRWDLVHPEQAANADKVFAEVFRTGQPGTVLSRMRHKDGHWLWIELKARRVKAEDEDGPAELVYSGRDVTWRVNAEQELERLARHDTLTGLANRLHFDERLATAVARSRRTQRPLALLYLDVDRFKEINDSHGHAVGDALLQAFAAHLQACLRATDLAARLGGDEFVVLVEDLESLDAPVAIARKLVEGLRDGLDAGAMHLTVTTSIGIAQGIPADKEELMRQADGALYAAKAAGRDTWRVADCASG